MSTALRTLRALSDAELLAQLGLDPPCAAEALTRAGGLRKLLAIPSPDAPARTGLPRADHQRLRIACELGRRHLASSLEPGAILATRDQAKHFALALTRDLPIETFHAIWLDAHQRVLTTDELARGTVDTARVYPREVVRRGLEVNATGTLLLHNHVSGIALPSDDDRRLTERLVNLLASVRIQIFDHLIVGHGTVASFDELGILPAADPTFIA